MIISFCFVGETYGQSELFEKYSVKNKCIRILYDDHGFNALGIYTFLYDVEKNPTLRINNQIFYKMN